MNSVNVITGDCGFMVSFQEIAQVEAERLGRPVPIILSALAQTGMIGHSLALNEKMMIMTANEANLKAIQCLIKEQAGTDCSDPRFVIVGCENVPGFEAVANGDKVFPEIVEPGVVELAKEKIKQDPKITAIVLECTELPRYANALRQSTKLPVFDMVTCCNAFIDGFREERKYGKRNWQDPWDREQEPYKFGQNCSEEEKKEMVNKPED